MLLSLSRTATTRSKADAADIVTSFARDEEEEVTLTHAVDTMVRASREDTSKHNAQTILVKNVSLSVAENNTRKTKRVVTLTSESVKKRRWILLQ